MDISLILTKNYPGTLWTLDGEEYAGLEWLDETPKPTKAALEKQWPDVQYETNYAAVQQQRQFAYQQEADPIFFQAQRGKKTEKEWLDKIKEIDERYPYPVKESKK